MMRPRGRASALTSNSEVEISECLFARVVAFAQSQTGISLGSANLLGTSVRLHRVCKKVAIATVGQLMDMVEGAGNDELKASLIEALTTHTTHFFREPMHFEVMTEVLPAIARASNREVRIWSAACSSGQEPYSIAMAIEESFARGEPRYRYKILATDVSQDILERAKTGHYNPQQLDQVPELLQARYFQLVGSSFEVRSKLRNQVVFRQLNLVTDPFVFRTGVDIVFCRNVLIYFDEPTTLKVVRKIHGCLARGGLLFTGHSESLMGYEKYYKYYKNTIYRKEEIE